MMWDNSYILKQKSPIFYEQMMCKGMHFVTDKSIMTDKSINTSLENNYCLVNFNISICPPYGKT